MNSNNFISKVKRDKQNLTVYYFSSIYRLDTRPLTVVMIKS